MNKTDLPLAGAFVVDPAVARDERGSFVKTFHADTFARFGVQPHFVEEFYSVSAKDVVRGMHFQRPPHDHAKLVCCLRGAVRDVLLDLRTSSPTFGRAVSVDLTAENRRVLYLPTGFAHGFRSLEQDSLVLYKTTAVYSQAHDTGIRWDSFGFDWGVATPVVSARDRAFPSLAGFVSPFA